MQAALQDAVDQLVRTDYVPGAVLGVSVLGRVDVAVAGVTDVRTSTPMRPDTLFLLGSVTKVWVTTLLMSLVDSGLVELDKCVVDYLPGFRVASSDATEQMTVRMLLSHSSGIDAADFIVDLGDDAEAIARYVELLADKGQLHQPGAFASYNNAGFVVAGRIIEQVTGTRWEDAMRERLIAPLGLQRTQFARASRPPDEAAIGHFPSTNGVMPTSRFLLPAALAPAGSTLLASAADALAFAQVYLDGGGPLLSPTSAGAMTTPCLPWPAPGIGGIALGWWWEPPMDDGVQMFTHTGGSLGGLALLAIIPERQIAVVAYVNSTASATALPALRQAALDAIGIRSTPQQPVPFADVDARSFVGTFRRYGITAEIRRSSDSGLELATKPELDVVADYLSGQVLTRPVRPVGTTALALAPTPVATSGLPMAWLISADETSYLYFGGRLARRY